MLIESVLLFLLIISSTIGFPVDDLEHKTIEHVKTELEMRGLKPHHSRYITRGNANKYGIDPDKVSHHLIPKVRTKLYFVGVNTDNLEQIFKKRPTTTAVPDLKKNEQGGFTTNSTTIVITTKEGDQKKRKYKKTKISDKPKLNQNKKGNRKVDAEDEQGDGDGGGSGSDYDESEKEKSTTVPTDEERPGILDGFIGVGCIIDEPVKQLGPILDPITKVASLKLKTKKTANCINPTIVPLTTTEKDDDQDE